MNIFEEKLNTDVWLNVLSDMLPKWDKSILKTMSQIVNVKKHWQASEFKFYKENHLELTDLQIIHIKM